MDYLDTIQQKREEAQRQAERKEELSTVDSVGERIDKSLKFQTAKIIAATKTGKTKLADPVASPDDIEKLSDVVADLTIASHVNQTKTVRQLEELNELVEKLPKNFPDYPEFPEFPKFPEPLKKISINNLDEIKPWLEAVTDALAKLELSPTINVAPTPVTIPKLDLTPIANALKAEDKAEPINLTSYKFHNLIGDDSFQYIGYLAPDGGWYIIENDIAGNSLRYAFGKKNYTRAWKQFNSHSFKLLSEAIREVQG